MCADLSVSVSLSVYLSLSLSTPWLPHPPALLCVSYIHYMHSSSMLARTCQSSAVPRTEAGGVEAAPCSLRMVDRKVKALLSLLCLGFLRNSKLCSLQPLTEPQLLCQQHPQPRRLPGVPLHLLREVPAGRSLQGPRWSCWMWFSL